MFGLVQPWVIVSVRWRGWQRQDSRGSKPKIVFAVLWLLVNPAPTRKGIPKTTCSFLCSYRCLLWSAGASRDLFFLRARSPVGSGWSMKEEGEMNRGIFFWDTLWKCAHCIKGQLLSDLTWRNEKKLVGEKRRGRKGKVLKVCQISLWWSSAVHVIWPKHFLALLHSDFCGCLYSCIYWWSQVRQSAKPEIGSIWLKLEGSNSI